MNLPLVLTVLLVLCTICLEPSTSAAQSTGSQRRLGLGAQVGNPTGMTLKYYFRTNWSGVFLVSWNLDRFLLMDLHAIKEHPIPDSPLRFFAGPGIFSFRDSSNRDSRFRFGLSVLTGLNFYTGHFEVFLQTNPNIRLSPNLKLSIGGAVGLRYYY